MFSPGPWRVGKNGSVVTDSVVGLGSCDAETLEHYGGNVICETVTPSNAALIAVAPELLELLICWKELISDYDVTLQAQVQSLIHRAHGFGA